jgi:outer membrane lipopolysaccharide assembly protein LptE/RlpB
VAAVALAGGGCGYRLAGHSGAGLPAAIRAIAVPAFQNETFTYKIEQSMTAAVIHELLFRTSYRVQTREEGSDAVLNGVVAAISSSPIVFDPNSGRTTEVLLTVSLRVQLLDTSTRQTIYEVNDFVFREPYEVSTDPAVYFGENQPALERLSRRVAASLVASLLENF